VNDEGVIPHLDVFSFGGGVQSTAVLVLAATHRVDCAFFVFANVGEDSENPATLRYMEEHSEPYAAQHGIVLDTVAKKPTLYQHALESTTTVAVPMRMSNGAPGNRTCTDRWKIAPIAKRLRELGFSKTRPATMGLGISADEWQRARTDSGQKHIRIAYPLLDLKIDRTACEKIILKAGLPVPPRSSCWFCPYHRVAVWDKMRRDNPALFARAAVFERAMSEKRRALGKDAVYLSSRAKPLDKAFPEETPGLFDDANCESGHCFT
jgi:hypothetical protein